MTETFGSRDHARALFNYFNTPHGPEFFNSNYEQIPAPTGFRYLGSGCYRTTFVHEDSNLVYKLGNYEANVSEAYQSRRLGSRSKRGLPFDLRIPRTRTFAMPGSRRYRNAVTVQEYAANARFTYCESQNTWMDEIPDCDCYNEPCFANVLSTISAWSGLEDIHGENVLVDESDVFWIIDLAQ